MIIVGVVKLLKMVFFVFVEFLLNRELIIDGVYFVKFSILLLILFVIVELFEKI